MVCIIVLIVPCESSLLFSCVAARFLACVVDAKGIVTWSQLTSCFHYQYHQQHLQQQVPSISRYFYISEIDPLCLFSTSLRLTSSTSFHHSWHRWFTCQVNQDYLSPRASFIFTLCRYLVLSLGPFFCLIISGALESFQSFSTCALRIPSPACLCRLHAIAYHASLSIHLFTYVKSGCW